MTITEAIRILGLKSEFTKDDLVKAYRASAKKYHPDIVGEAGTEKMKQINAAFKVCEQHLQYRRSEPKQKAEHRTTTTYSYQRRSSSTSYVDGESFYDFKDDTDIDEEFKKIYEHYRRLFEDPKTREKLIEEFFRRNTQRCR